MDGTGWRRELEIQCIDIYIYPPEYFCPMNYYTGEIIIMKNIRLIHHYSESWSSENNQRVNHTMRLLVGRFGKKTGYRMWCIYAFPYRFQRKLHNIGLKER